MWCLQTIVALNEAASKRAGNGESISLAYKDVGISSVTPISPVVERAEKFKRSAKYRVIKPDSKTA